MKLQFLHTGKVDAFQIRLEESLSPFPFDRQIALKVTPVYFHNLID